MSVFSGILGHTSVLHILDIALHHPAQAYLFCGPRGVGKRTVAERFISALLDESRIDTHPDFVRMRRAEGTREIVVKQVRELVARMHLTAARGGYKVALIEQADRLNEEAANALLKAVEEPSPNTVYIFLAEQPDRLPATLRSRLVKMEFGRLKAEDRARIVKEAEEQAWYDDLDWSALTVSLLQSSLGHQLAVIDKITQAVESQADPETAWHEAFEHLMQALDQHFADQPEAAACLGRGLSQAWRMVGSSISPRLAIEYALIPEEAKQGRMVPRMLAGR